MKNLLIRGYIFCLSVGVLLAQVGVGAPGKPAAPKGAPHRAIPSIQLELIGRIPSAPAVSLAFYQDRLLAVSDGRSLSFWSVATRTKQFEFDVDRYPILLNSDVCPSRSLAAAIVYDDTKGISALALWNIQTKKLIRIIRGGGSRDAYWKNISFSPKGATLASSHGTEEGTYSAVDLTNIETGQGRTLSRRVSNIVKFSPSGELLAVSSDNNVGLWDVNSGRLLRSFASPNASSVAFSKDGQMLACVSPNQTYTGGYIRVWNATNSKQIANIRITSYSPGALTFADNSSIIVGGGKDPESKNDKVVSPGDLEIWSYNFKTKQFRLRRKMEGTPITAVCLSPNGKVLATSESGTSKEAGGAIKLWKMN